MLKLTALEHINRDKCYRVKKVPALVEYNTRGINVRGSSRSWKGNFEGKGAVVRDKYHPKSAVCTAPQPTGLFRDTDLILNIQSTTNEITHAEILGHCASLDLISDAGMFGAAAECDRQSFSYAVNGHTIVVFKDNAVFREYELKPGNYMINGYPVIFN